MSAHNTLVHSVGANRRPAQPTYPRLRQRGLRHSLGNRHPRPSTTHCRTGEDTIVGAVAKTTSSNTNPSKQSSEQQETRKKSYEKETHWSYACRHALCTLLFRRGAAAEESRADRISIVLSAATESTRPRNSAGSARAWLHRRTEHRYRVPIWGGEADRLPELAAELVRLKVDIIVVAGGDRMIRAAKDATKTIPSL